MAEEKHKNRESVQDLNEAHGFTRKYLNGRTRASLRMIQMLTIWNQRNTRGSVSEEGENLLRLKGTIQADAGNQYLITAAQGGKLLFRSKMKLQKSEKRKLRRVRARRDSK